MSSTCFLFIRLKLPERDPVSFLFPSWAFSSLGKWLILPLSLPTVLGLPSQVEELCPDIPALEVLMKDIHDLAESGARYTEMPHVIEITLPMLCNYLPRWWERGLENFPEQEGRICTSVTSEQLNQLLGSIMKIVVNNLGIDEASWMKRLAGECPGLPLLFLGAPRLTVSVCLWLSVCPAHR